MKELKFQLSTALLTILTLAAGITAFFNFEQQRHFNRLAEDGAIWVDRSGHVEALYVKAGSGAANAGIHPGDRLISINTLPIRKALDVPKVLAAIGTWIKADYVITHGGIELAPFKVITQEVPLDRLVIYQYVVGAFYLLIGLFVYFRRGSAHKAQHFYVLCLTSFIAFTFHYTGQLNSFDQIVLYGNVAAGLIAPTVFLHFCLTFPETAQVAARKNASGSAVSARRPADRGLCRGQLRSAGTGDSADRAALAAGPDLRRVCHRAVCAQRAGREPDAP